MKRLLIGVLLLCGSVLLTGCGSSDSVPDNYNLSVGQKLYFSDGINPHAEYGTIVSLEDAHQFENGDIEPGALVDYGPRIPNTPPQWLPQRSAAKFAE